MQQLDFVDACLRHAQLGGIAAAGADTQLNIGFVCGHNVAFNLLAALGNQPHEAAVLGV